MPPAARIGDQHVCPSGSHVGGPVADGSATVRIGGMPAARVGDRSTCQGAIDTVAQGASTVLIEGRPAARAGDRSTHNGVIVAGCPTVVIGNQPFSPRDVSGGSEAAGAEKLVAAAATTPHLFGAPVSTQVLDAMNMLSQSLLKGGGLLPAVHAGLQSASTTLELAMARHDLGAIRRAAPQLQEMLQKAGVRLPGSKPPDAEGVNQSAPKGPPRSGWMEAGAVPADPPRHIAVRDGRLAINHRHAGLHAIGAFDLIERQAAGEINQVVQYLVVASGAGRNCARILCMYNDHTGQLSPRTTAGYWTAIDALIARLAAHGMFGEFVLFAPNQPGSAVPGVMPSWEDRRAFAREAGLFFQGKPVIVTGIQDLTRGDNTTPDDTGLIDAMQIFREASRGTVPFSIAAADSRGGRSAGGVHARQQALASSGASILTAHVLTPRPDQDRYRPWIDTLPELSSIRSSLPNGNPILYHSETMAFAARRQSDRDDDDPEAAVAAACVCAVEQLGFCYHVTQGDELSAPGLDLTRVATLVPQSPDFAPFEIGEAGSPIATANAKDFPGGSVRCCFNGLEAWAVGYARKIAKAPRVEWRGQTPEIVWQGERVILWRAR